MKTILARRRSKKYPTVYRKLAEFVRGIRKRMQLTQPQFAKFLGVSEISVRRWETALGHKPSEEVMKKLKEVSQNGNSIDNLKTVFGAQRARDQENYPE
jgi:DNA-binding transcriptional regulator YiaG